VKCPIGKTCKNGKCEGKAQCKVDTDCPAGLICEAGTCKACKNDGQCGPGGKCVGGACDRPKKCGKDEDCADDEDCINGVCQKPWQGNTGGTASCSLNTVYFAFDDSSVAASERERLEGNHTCIDKNAGRNVYLVGHTDVSGTDEYNIALSERRARTVADYLARLGTDPARLQVVPKGETESTGLGDDKDRRVEFQWR
jgi:peptidoglycan-associated lipoprotein